MVTDCSFCGKGRRNQWCPLDDVDVGRGDRAIWRSCDPWSLTQVRGQGLKRRLVFEPGFRTRYRKLLLLLSSFAGESGSTVAQPRDL